MHITCELLLILSLQKQIENHLLSQEFFALAYDSAQVLKQALNKELCSVINDTALTLDDKETLSTCIKKVTI